MRSRPVSWPAHRARASRATRREPAPTIACSVGPDALEAPSPGPSRLPSTGLARAPAQPAAVGLNMRIVKTRYAQALRECLRTHRVAGVAEMQETEQSRVRAVAAGKDTAMPQHPEHLGEQSVLQLGRRDMMQHRETHHRAVLLGRQAGVRSVAVDDPGPVAVLALQPIRHRLVDLD